LLREPTFGKRERGPALGLRLRLDQVGKALCLGQVDPSALECTAGELPGLRRSQPIDRRE
jgi:hypothetical protein